ncbi:oxidoreductase [Nocardia sp. R6R-6]|uniref:oxidoreductase n=1 Tax=Nocardia sp. R6R-6 TaxID=3459303 RepID=UPI00403D70B4
MTTAFDPIDFVGKRLPNRIVMAPMTRSRAHDPGAIATPAMATYYAQRASAGLIVSESIQPSAVGQAHPFTPGLHSPEQVAAWRPVTDAVHAAGGTIFAQLMHAGRVRHPSLLSAELALVGPSPVAAADPTSVPEDVRDLVTPIELTEAGIAETIEDFARAARNAVEAGFDGVELHGANGFLLHQFLSTNVNQRTDRWGGSIEGRIRFPLEVVRAVVEAIGASRVGLRISPAHGLNGIVEDGHRDTYRTLVEALEALEPAYLHVMEMGDKADRDLTLELRKRFSGTFILNPATPNAATGTAELSLIEDGTADMISFGALFLANPDLPARLAAGGPFNTPDPATFYGGDERGYTDYPRLDD